VVDGEGGVYRRIVVGVAKSESSARAVEVAIDLAQRYDAHLHLVMAFERSRGAPVGDARDEAETHLSRIGAACPVDVSTHAVPGDPAASVVRIADEVDADLVVVGNQGMKGTARRVLGSIPNTIAHSAPCSVLIVDTTG
jgi:nucleotide-binding universal stress UspA family protein